MRIAVVGGRSRADYLIEVLKRDGNEIVAINDDREFCHYLSDRHDIDVTWGDATKRYVLDDAEVDDFDIIVVLTGNDADSFAICQLAQHFYDIDFQLCMVSDPRNVDVFRRLGVTAVISATSMLADMVRQTLADATYEKRNLKAGLTGSFKFHPDDSDDSGQERVSARVTSSFHRITGV